MVAVGLIAVFLIVGLICLQFPLSEYDTIVLTFCIAGGLVAVVIAATSMIMGKLNSIHKLMEESKKSEEKKTPENNTKEDKENN